MKPKIQSPLPTTSDPAVGLHGLVRKPRQKWFAHTDHSAETGWSGPHETIEAAAHAALSESSANACYIAQGRKLTNSEYEEQGAEYTWEVDTQNALMLRLLNDRLEPSGVNNPKLRASGKNVQSASV